MRSGITQHLGISVLGLCVILAAPGKSPAQQCVGDCNGDGVVTIAELITGVNIDLNGAAVGACPALDCEMGSVGHIDCLIVAVNSALNGCRVRTPQPPKPVAYVTDGISDTVSVIDIATNTVEATVVVGSGLRPLGIALHPHGTVAYVANPESDTVSVVDLQAMTTTTIALPNCPELGCRPEAVVASPDGAFVYVLNHPFNAVWVEVIDAATGRVVAHTAANT
jgi:YVTN family beta-propeller protein